MDATTASVLWIPVGAGSRVVPWTSRAWELGCAILQHRRPLPLVHAALELSGPSGRLAVEMAPAWRPGGATRGVVATDPVGLRRLGRSRWFRYEVRCWPDGDVPDRDAAVEVDAIGLPVDALARVPALCRAAPMLVWGRRVAGEEMWNSNSLIAWLLAQLRVEGVGPPAGCRAPGWATGVSVAGAPGAGGPTVSPRTPPPPQQRR